MINGGEVQIDTDRGLIRNDTVWKGFFPRGHVMNRLSTAFHASFKKRFGKGADGKIVGVTSDSDNVINDDLLIGRAHLGEYPHGLRLFTFPMVRSYGLDNMTVADHRSIWDKASVPTKDQLNGLWEMRMVSNANNTGVVAYLKFEPKPDGRLEARYQFLGLIEGLS